MSLPDSASPSGSSKEHGHWPPNWIGLFHALSGKPAEYLLLVVLLGGLAWFVDREQRHREQVYAPLLAACLKEFQK